MVRLSTQPTASTSTASVQKPIALRSGFYALPLKSNSLAPQKEGLIWIYARIHSRSTEVDEDEPMTREEHKSLFVTGLPLGVTSSNLNKLFSGIYTTNKIRSIELLPSTAPNSSNTLLSRDAITSIGDVTSLFDHSSPETTCVPSLSSAIIHFKAAVAQFPPPNTSQHSFPLSKRPIDYLTLSRNKYDQARPNRSIIISHTDTWMQNFDSKKIKASAAVSNPSTSSFTSSGAVKKTKKSKKELANEILPGSASHAIQEHNLWQAKLKDPNYNPDQGPDEDGWTLVTRGGRHGTSLLPGEGLDIHLNGYGGKNVKVARKKKLGEGEQEDLEVGQRKIVGDGFYRFTKADERKKELAQLRDRFEQDKNRLSKFRAQRDSNRGHERSRGGKSDRGGAREKRSFKPY